MCTVEPHKRRKNRVVPDEIPVFFAGRVESRVKGWTDNAKGKYPNICVQQGIKSDTEFIERRSERKIDMCDLPAGVNPTVGSSTAMDPGLNSGQPLKGLFQFSLNGADSRLNLPTLIVGSIVGDPKGQADRAGVTVGRSTGRMQPIR